jgi:hypothetical protein
MPRRAPIVALLIGIAACDSSTTAPPPTPAASAAFFDSIYTASQAKGTYRDSIYADFIAEEFELPPAYGAQQATFEVTTTGGNQRWRGFAYGASNGTWDTSFTIAAFSDAKLTNIILIGISTGPGGGAALYTGNFTAGFPDSTIAGSWASSMSVGAPCALQAGLRAAPLLSPLSTGTTCHNATFTLSSKATFLPVAGVGALQVWSISGVTFNGPTFVSPPPSSPARPPLPRP